MMSVPLTIAAGLAEIRATNLEKPKQKGFTWRFTNALRS
jgi:hypothetical protein